MKICLYLHPAEDRDLLDLWDDWGGRRRAQRHFISCVELALMHTKDKNMDLSYYTKYKGLKKSEMLTCRINIDPSIHQLIYNYWQALPYGEKYQTFIARVRQGQALAVEHGMPVTNEVNMAYERYSGTGLSNNKNTSIKSNQELARELGEDAQSILDEMTGFMDDAESEAVGEGESGELENLGSDNRMELSDKDAVSTPRSPSAIKAIREQLNASLTNMEGSIDEDQSLDM